MPVPRQTLGAHRLGDPPRADAQAKHAMTIERSAAPVTVPQSKHAGRWLIVNRRALNSGLDRQQGTGSESFLEPVGRDFRRYPKGTREMRRTPDKLWHDAVHEAGHVVVARALGLTAGYANFFLDCAEISAHAFIFDALQALAGGRLQSARKEDDAEFWHDKIIARMAGAEAEREIIGMCLGADGDDHGQLKFGDDLAYADEEPEHAVRMRRFARQLVKRHQDAILRFAEQLVAAAELDELVAR